MHVYEHLSSGELVSSLPIFSSHWELSHVGRTGSAEPGMLPDATALGSPLPPKWWGKPLTVLYQAVFANSEIWGFHFYLKGQEILHIWVCENYAVEQVDDLLCTHF